MINPDPHLGGSSRSSTDIESDIRRTRGRMDATLDELGNRLTARSVLHTILDIWESRQGCTPESEARTQKVYGALTQQVASQVRENPVPTMLIGAGIAWLFMDRNKTPDNREYVEMSGRRYRVRPSTAAAPIGGIEGAPVAEYEYEDLEYDEIDDGPGLMDRAKEKLAQGKDAIADAAAAAKDRIAGAGEAARGRFTDVRDSARGRAEDIRGSARVRASRIGGAAQSAADRVKSGAREAYVRSRVGGQEAYSTGVERFQGAVQETPLGVGLGFAALGALVGLLMPHTRREDELLGERSDELVDTLKEKSREALQAGKHVAERVAETALDEAQKQGFTAQAATEKLSELASKAGAVAQRVKEEATTAVKEEKSSLAPSTPGLSGSNPSNEWQSSSNNGGVSEGLGESQSLNMPPKGASGTGMI